MLSPGVTKVFKDKQSALDHLNKKLTSDAKQLFKVVFQVSVSADQPPCDVSKCLGEDPEMKEATLCHGLFQRLTAQVKKYSADHDGKLISSKTVREAINKKDGDATRVKNIFQAIHYFEIKQIQNPNDPKTASESLSQFTTPAKWKSFLATV